MKNMKLVFLLTAWIVHVGVFSQSASDISETDMKIVYDRISEEMLLAFTRSLKMPSNHRQKREVSYGSQSLIDDSGVYRLSSVKPVAKLCHPAIRTLFVDVYNVTYAVCLTEVTLNTPAEVFVGIYREHTWIPTYSWLVQNPTDVAAFHYKRNLYVLVTDSHRESGTDLVRINLSTGNMVSDHLVHSSYSTGITIWKMKNNYNMAIANSVVSKDSVDLSTKVYVYEWKEAYFDRYASFQAYYVTDIEAFQIHGSAFIAVANFKKGRNAPEVDSEILRYDIDENAWLSYQKIRTYGAMDWEFFTLGTDLGQDFFLAVANKGVGKLEDKSMIYKFAEDKFLPFQCLQTTKATSISSYSMGSTFVLAVANENDAVHLYQYDGWLFVKSIQFTRGSMSYGVVHLDFHRVIANAHNAVILSVSNPKQPNYESVFEFGFVYEDYLEDWHGKSTDWCLKVLSKIEKTDIDKSIGSFEDVIFTDQPEITIHGDITFENGFEAKTLKTPKLTDVSTQQTYDDNLLIKLADLQKRLEAIKGRLSGFAKTLKHSLKIDGNQNITSHLEFQDAKFDCKSHTCHFKNIHTDILNGEDIRDWAQQLVFLDSNQVINGTLYAKEVNATSIHVHGLVDGVKIEHLVTKSGNHNVTGHKIFNDLITVKDLKVDGKVDGIKISPDEVLLKTGHQTIYGNLTFDSVQTSWLKTKNVNGRDFSMFYNDLVFVDRPSTITGAKTFRDITVGELVMSNNSKINRIDLMDLWRNVLWVDENQEITAEMSFLDVVIDKNLDVLHKINGIQIPGERVVDISEPAVITAPYVFENTTKISKLNVLESLNGLPLVHAPDGSKQLDILLKIGDQTVTGTKIFHTIHLDADSYVHGTVDGVDLSEFANSVLHKDKSLTTNGTWVFNNLIIKGPLTVDGKVSGFDLKDVYDRALKLNDTNIPEMVFNDLVTVEELDSHDINDIDIGEDLVLVNKPQEITGKKVFKEVILEEDTTVQGLVNNMNLSFFNEVLLRIGNQTINSKVFKRNVVIKDLTVTGSINGVPVSDMVLLNGGQIYGSRTLRNVSFTKVEAKNIGVTGKVNNIDVQEMIDDTMTYDGYETVKGTKKFTGTIYITNGSNLKTNDLNGIDIEELWNDAVFIDISQNITGEKIFKENVVFESLSFDSTLDGVSDWDMRHNWMLKTSPQTAEGSIVFKNGFTASDLLVGEVNGIDIELLNSEIVKTNEAAEVEGPIFFENIVSNGNVNLTGKIQGVDLSEEVVFRDNVFVTGEKAFLNDIVIESDLTVDGTVDGINVEELCSNVILGNKEQNISRLVIKGDVTFVAGGSVGGNIAGVDLKLLQEVAVKNDGSPIKFTGLKKFDNVTFEGPVTIEGKVGNLNMNDLANNYMSLTKDQDILSKMQFEHLLFEGTLSATNLNTHTKEINGINLQQLDARILKSSGTQSITAAYHIDDVHFEDDVFVAGKVNGLDVPSGLMRHNHTNYIQSPKTFEKAVLVFGDLEMEAGRTIQGIDVSDWAQKAVLKDGKFDIHGYKTFHHLYLHDVIAEGLLDGLKISEDHLLMTYGNQVITGTKTIIGNVSIDGSLAVDGLINGIDFVNFSMETMQRDRTNTVTGLKTFSKPLTVISLQAPTVAGVDILKLQGKLNTSLNFEGLENRFDEIETVMSRMQTAFDNQAVIFQYYELFDQFDIPTAYNWLYVPGKGSGEFLLLFDNSSSTAPCSSIRIFGYDETLGRFIPAQQELMTSYAVSAKTLQHRNSTYVFVANQIPHSACSSSNDIGKSTIDVYAWEINAFSKIQSLVVLQPLDIVVFKDGHLACLVTLEYNGTTVHCTSDNTRNFVRREVLYTTGGKKASAINSMGNIFLAVAAEDASIPRNYLMEGQKYIDIYMLNMEKYEFSAPRQVLQSTFVQSIILMNYKHKYSRSEMLFLAAAEGSIPSINNEPKIIIYRCENPSQPFLKYQVIHDYGTLEWLSLNTGELLFFVVDALHGQIKVYQYKGASGFVKIDTIKSIGTTALHPFVRSRQEDWFNHYLALAGPRSIMAQPSQGIDYAKILKSKVKGMRAFH